MDTHDRAFSLDEPRYQTCRIGGFDVLMELTTYRLPDDVTLCYRIQFTMPLTNVLWTISAASLSECERRARFQLWRTIERGGV